MSKLPIDLHGGGFAYVRAYYHVPAKRMGRVRYRGQSGTVTGCSQGKLIVRPDARRYKGLRMLCHPRDLEYLP